MTRHPYGDTRLAKFLEKRIDELRGTRTQAEIAEIRMAPPMRGKNWRGNLISPRVHQGSNEPRVSKTASLGGSSVCQA